MAAMKMILQSSAAAANACAEATAMAIGAADSQDPSQQDPLQLRDTAQRCRAIMLKAAYNGLKTTQEMTARNAVNARYSLFIKYNAHRLEERPSSTGGDQGARAMHTATHEVFTPAMESLYSRYVKLEKLISRQSRTALCN